MKIILLAVLLVGGPTCVWAGTSAAQDRDGFDFNQPFDDAMAKGLLRSFLNQALDAIEDHVEMKGRLRQSPQGGEEEGRLELRVYPHGKSRSHDHVAAEGWFRFSPDLLNNEMTLRFRSSQEPAKRSQPGEPDVL